MDIFKRVGVSSLKAWGHAGVAPGYLYETVESLAPKLYSKSLKAKLYNGYKVQCDIRESIQQILYFFGYYEAIETYWITQLLKPGQVMIDAGANIGYFSLVGANLVGAKGKVISFEPIPKNFATLQTNIDLNNLRGIITATNAGLWDTNETLRFGQAEATANNNGTFSAGTTEDLANAFECKVMTLDSFVESNNIGQIDFMKMDIEGAELQALKGAMESLRKFKPTLLIEICKYTCDRFGYATNDIWELLKPLGYKMHLIGRSNESSKPLENLVGIEQNNVLFYQGELPNALKEHWDLASLRKNFF